MTGLVEWTVELVGPHGYIHGWIKVGMVVEHKDGSKGVVTHYDPNTQTAHIDFKSGPRVGKANKRTTKAYHLVRPGAGTDKAPEAPKPPPIVPKREYTPAEIEKARNAWMNPGPSKIDQTHPRVRGAMDKALEGISPKVKSRLTSVRIVDYHPNPDIKGATTDAVYETTYGSHGKGTLTVGQHLVLDPKLESGVLDAEKQGYLAKTGHTTGLDRTVAHELGHHLLDNMTDQQKQNMFRAIFSGPTWDHPAPPVGHGVSPAQLVKANQEQIKQRVGEYATASPAEFIAELWAKHTGGNDNAISELASEHIEDATGDLGPDVGYDEPESSKDKQDFPTKRGTLVQTEGQELADQLTARPDLINGQALRSLRLADAEMTKRSRAGDPSYNLDTHARVRVAMAHRQKELEHDRKGLPVKNIKAATDEELSERRKVLDPKRKAGQTTYPEENELAAIKDEQRTRRAVKRGGPIVSGTATPAEGAKYRATIGKIIKEGPTNAPPLISLKIGGVSSAPGLNVIADMDHSGNMRVTNKMDLHSDAVTRKHQESERSGWFTRAEKADTSAHAQLTHEYGHHLDATLSPGARSSLLYMLGNNLGFDHPIGSVDDGFTATEKANIVNKVGSYAATNKSELVAELYKASRLGNNPSKAALIVGEFMDQYHGGTK